MDDAIRRARMHGSAQRSVREILDEQAQIAMASDTLTGADFRRLTWQALMSIDGRLERLETDVAFGRRLRSLAWAVLPVVFSSGAAAAATAYYLVQTVQ